VVPSGILLPETIQEIQIPEAAYDGLVEPVGPFEVGMCVPGTPARAAVSRR